MNTIVIHDFNELASYAEKLPFELEWFKENEFSFDENISGIKLHVKGERFDSSISTTLMRSVLKLQESIYRQYSLFAYGEVKKLSPEEYAMLEIYAKIEQGSSWIELIPKPIIDAISEKIKKMTTKQFIGTIAAVSIAATLCVSSTKIIDHKFKIKEMEIQAQQLSDVQKNTIEAQIEIVKAQTEFFKEIAKQTGSEKIEINGEDIDLSDIKTKTSSPREKSVKTQSVLNGDYKVTDIHIDDEWVSIDVIDRNDEVIKNVTLLEGLINQDDYRMLKESTNRVFMPMKIIVSLKNDKIESAILDSIETP